MFRFPILLALAVIFMPTASHALNEGLQCVPYARALTGVEIRGDAHTWWGQAKGRYARGSRPKVGAIMSFRPHGGMRLGHVAAVRKVIDKRTVVISHANWSTINGKRGHVEENVKVVDASANNDWSRVRVWYSPNNALGGTKWPLNGFIYTKQQLGSAQQKKRLVALIGNRAKLTPVPSRYASAPVRLSAKAPSPRKPKKSPVKLAKNFNLSSSLLRDIDRKSASESRAAKPAQGNDRIGSLIASLGH